MAKLNELVIDASVISVGRVSVISLSLGTISIYVWRMAFNVIIVVNAIIKQCIVSSGIKLNVSATISS